MFREKQPVLVTQWTTPPPSIPKSTEKLSSETPTTTKVR